MHIKSICQLYRYMQLRRLDGTFLGKCRATADGEYCQIEEQAKLWELVNIEAGHDLPREHPAAPGEAQRDALGIIYAHIDVTA